MTHTILEQKLAELEKVIMPLENMWAEQVKQKEVHRWEIMYGFTPEMLRNKVKDFLRSFASALLESIQEEMGEMYQGNPKLITQKGREYRMVTLKQEGFNDALSTLSTRLTEIIKTVNPEEGI